MHDEEGNWIGGFAMNIRTWTVEEAEAWEVLKGLKVAYEKGVRKLFIKSDSKEIINMFVNQRNKHMYHNKIANTIV